MRHLLISSVLVFCAACDGGKVYEGELRDRVGFRP